jgi:hypothetical protein
MAGTRGRRWKCISKPCSICGRWFEPSPRARRHQKTCSSQCSRERHRRKCKQWREDHRDLLREGRLRERLTPPEATEPRGPPAQIDPLAQIDLGAARDAVGLEVVVLIEVLAQELVRFLRDAVGRQPVVISRVSGQVCRETVRDGMANRAPPP